MMNREYRLKEYVIVALGRRMVVRAKTVTGALSDAMRRLAADEEIAKIDEEIEKEGVVEITILKSASS